MSCKYVEVRLAAGTDGTIRFALSPPTPIGDWQIAASFCKRFNSEQALFSKYTVSGGGGASGIAVIDAAQGVTRIDLAAIDTSGRQGNLALFIHRLGSGVYTQLAYGYVVLGDDVR